MKIYLVYEQFHADWSNGEDDEVFIENAYKNKRKAVKKAKELLNKAKADSYFIDESHKNRKNPFKNNNCVDLYREESDQETKVRSIVIEETKLVA